MELVFTSEQNELRDSLRRFLDARSPEAFASAAIENIQIHGGFGLS
jgi:hypothetical protein